MSRALLAALVAGAVALGAAPTAHADRAKSLELFGEGKKKFNLGEFDQAIALFKQAYEENPAPEYLYNIAQAYRQLEDCKKALFFYQRFLVEKPDAEHQQAIMDIVAELKGECGDKHAGAGAGAGSGTDSGSGAGSASGAGAGSGAGSAAGAGSAPGTASTPAATVTSTPAGSARTTGPTTAVTTEATARGPRLVASAELGAAYWRVGDVIVPVTMTARLAAAYPLRLGDLDLEAGLALELAPMPYDAMDGARTAVFTTVLAQLAARVPLSDTLAIGGELGLGAFVVPGLALGNPFVDSGRASDRATHLGLRVAATGDYRLGASLSLSGSLAYARGGTGAPLRAEIQSIAQVELLAGVRYHW